MIKVTVRQAARRRGIKNPYQLAQRLQPTDVEPKSSFQKLARRLWKDGARPSFATLDLVAAALGNCELSELIVRVPSGHSKTVSQKREAATKQSGANGLAKNSDSRQNNRRNGRRG